MLLNVIKSYKYWQKIQTTLQQFYFVDLQTAEPLDYGYHECTS